MNQKTLLIVAICAAVIGAGISGAIISNKKAAAAQAVADAAAARADEAAAEARAADKAAAAETEKRRAAEATAKAKADELAAAKVANETAELERQAAADQKAAAEANAKAEQAKSDAARAARDEAKAKAAEAESAAKAEQARVSVASAKAAEAAAMLENEKLKADKVIAEAKLLELRKTDFETLARDLAEWKADLEERERALKPEKTIADLSWAGGMEDTIIDADGNVKKQEKVAYDPETDMTIPAESRRLARAERVVAGELAEHSDKVRDTLVASLERLYRQALVEDRVVDAEFYRKSLKSLYPDWEFRPEESK